MDERERLEHAVIEAALNLAGFTKAHAFTLEIPNTTPQLYVSLHEGAVKLGLEDQVGSSED